jgi:hypothetical protein
MVRRDAELQNDNRTFPKMIGEDPKVECDPIYFRLRDVGSDMGIPSTIRHRRENRVQLRAIDFHCAHPFDFDKHSRMRGGKQWCNTASVITLRNIASQNG